LLTYIVRVNIAIGKGHGKIVFVHNLAADPAHDRGVEVMTQREVRGKRPKCLWVTHWAIDVAMVCLIAHGGFEGRKSSLKGNIQKGFGSEELKCKVIGAELSDQVVPSRLVIQPLHMGEAKG
jgi:hypothetical protein